jgi:hypothetical protein
MVTATARASSWRAQRGLRAQRARSVSVFVSALTSPSVLSLGAFLGAQHEDHADVLRAKAVANVHADERDGYAS